MLWLSCCSTEFYRRRAEGYKSSNNLCIAEERICTMKGKTNYSTVIKQSIHCIYINLIMSPIAFTKSEHTDTNVVVHFQISQYQKIKTFHSILQSFTYRVSPIIRPTRKIRPSVIFEDDFNVSPTLKISPS